MKAVCWYGKGDVRVREVPDPQILNPRDAIIRVTSTAICGSDLHIYDGYIPTMKRGDILGHEFMGEVVDLGEDVGNLRRGDRVVVPFTISCGQCFFCQQELWSLCDNSNPNAAMAAAVFGHSPAGLFGYSHLMGGYAGGQAEYVRVPFADVGPMPVPEEMSDEQALFLSDVLPTAYQAVDVCDPQPGDTVAIWGCGPVGLLAIQCAHLLGVDRVIAIDDVPERLDLAEMSGAETINMDQFPVVEELKRMTGGRGPDICIDAVGMESHGGTVDALYDRVMQSVRFETGRPHALREAIQACRKGGTVSMAGVYVGLLDKMPFGAAFNKGLTLKMGQTHVQRYMQPLMEHILVGNIDPTVIITHMMSLDDAPEAYRIFRDKEDGCIKAVLYPEALREREMFRERAAYPEPISYETPSYRVTPSQAEGDRETVEDNLVEKGLEDEVVH
ncbi:MAG TPA: glutathione-dependent formaldehyde dehydrogenase, partial [Chloroflexi bacterium]|nr:glutathione-dependent formaldehyde dehydrogenase [Chloroflexota bacterium]